jgi:hypothetical protein
MMPFQRTILVIYLPNAVRRDSVDMNLRISHAFDFLIQMNFISEEFSGRASVSDLPHFVNQPALSIGL